MCLKIYAWYLIVAKVLYSTKQDQYIIRKKTHIYLHEEMSKKTMKFNRYLNDQKLDFSVGERLN